LRSLGDFYVGVVCYLEVPIERLLGCFDVGQHPLPDPLVSHVLVILFTARRRIANTLQLKTRGCADRVD